MRVEMLPLTRPVSARIVRYRAGLEVVLDLVGSTLSDPYISYSAALFALAGPLHGYVASPIQLLRY